MRKYLLKFRESVKSPVKLAEVSLHEISKLSTSQEPAVDTPEIIFIRLRSKSRKFREQLKGRPFSYVEQDLQNADNLYFTFVEISEDNFVKRLSINQDDSREYTVDEEDGSRHTHYGSLEAVNPERRLFGGAILKNPQGSCECVGMLDFKDDEAKTLSPVFFSNLQTRECLNSQTRKQRRYRLVSSLAYDVELDNVLVVRETQIHSKEGHVCLERTRINL
ncbi:uncharacterized protein LOC111347225 isoform X2 [Stylophora pistillata]|uniref:uncharacterized protein LOC111347225 isoform X2 n=1 Tax=Stylophora pistillata TaxID=50429 RepID=UPI000C04A806|nr:uncharacterized protein LOC111347225 isoform X2 [Stylophora pistillata]